MIDRLETLLEDLSKTLQIPLHVDKVGACSIQIEPITIQIEIDEAQENIFLFSSLIELPPGKFREEIFFSALKENGKSGPRAGIFGYLHSSNYLTLHQKYPLEILTEERLTGMFGAFFDLAKLWKEEIHSGRIPLGAP